jgi:hypothetical protein
MSEACPFRPTPRHKKGNLLAAEVAGRQWGVIGADQLRDCGLTRSTVARWRRAGRLHLIHPAVYALGHPSVPVEGRLVAALLHGGEHSVLSHATAAWWWGLVQTEPTLIEISCTSRARSCPGVSVHRRQRVEKTRHRGFPVTTAAQTLLDYAADASLADVRRALANADYRGLLDLEAVRETAGQGRPGTARLRTGLVRHQPGLARTRSPLEERFIPLCESFGIPMPEINVLVEGWLVDAVWRHERVVVELDGYDNHRSPAQIERDRRKELELRALGFLVIRYTWHQVTREADQVAADLLARLLERRADESAGVT